MIGNWIEFAIGAWILLSPWIIGFANISIAKWSNVFCGLALVIMSAWRLFGEGEGEKQPKGPSN